MDGVAEAEHEVGTLVATDVPSLRDVEVPIHGGSGVVMMGIGMNDRLKERNAPKGWIHP